MTLKRALFVLAALVCAALGFMLWQQLERVEEVVDPGPSAEALADPYLAARRFLQAQRLNVSLTSKLSTYQELAPADSSLMILGSRRRMTPGQVQGLLGWVRKGGRLVIVGEGYWNAAKGSSGDRLLDTLNIRRVYAAGLPDAGKADKQAQPANRRKPPQQDLTELFIENEQAPARLGFEPHNHLEDPTDKAMAWANSARATHLMQLDWGDGVITVLSDANLWTNAHVGEQDNAWLLWYLNQDRNVTLLQRGQNDSWATLLLRHFPQALLALLLLALAWCAYHGVRRGPTVPAPLPNRRSLLEHLRASAAFMLRHHGQQSLLRTLRQDLHQRANLVHPGFNQLPVADQWQVLARLTRHSTSSIAQAMAPGEAGKRLPLHQFTQQVAQLQTLRNAL
ncbi:MULTISPECIES: DUF4350 domain-containing protein [unclassified Pseudomonas]|uniref:DUF4350 domain-containing protein n=1 Tax=unclassified Pseudomonas TaxID=196821 RepID=UPI000BDD687F|nr:MULTISPECIES: DUF4350 domain-containing protein [unclassified Pseudomonas]PVZ11198.1 uncharacterized protein DUF4350 [Pseudomonas sp. URIL14HWK12:I12]PVZ22196.1 uncharacterized protein DUF4350 [Pseudomonas sp. URIL14HWK12:I10]PVZ31680.1 uncharacterized protein DUF4350 [Pseudomonas sp. URIL14HWK12:I11]SNZ16787.1 protein of unknown function [Pseudomonas sp. URIL14HWK12:I9]